MKDKRGKISLDDAWFCVFEIVAKNRSVLNKQLDETKKMHPFLAQVFQLLICYSSHLERKARNATRGGMPHERDFPEIGIECAINLDNCRIKTHPEVVQDFIDYMDSETAFEGMGNGSVPDPGQYRRECQSIFDDYKKALQCIQKLSNIESLSPKQVIKLLNCMDDLNQSLNELLEAGCLHEFELDPERFPPVVYPED